MSILSVFLGIFFGILGASEALELPGVYKTQAFLNAKSSYVEFFEYKGKFYAYGISNADGSNARKDKNNPDPRLRNRSDKGVVFLSDLTQVGHRYYKGGKAYNFYDGRTYYVKVVQNDNGDLEFTPSYDKWGYVGKTFTWKRLDNQEIKSLKIKRFDLGEVIRTIP
ncbi:DUF2147 domain-containing protein [Helicobacter cetorum]|uniref:DUF2147 domain-containing protein n=1 Tax=Helicobacter cetorum TaxID=138563 RepID=UPI0005C66C04|nr:DUF2147 domain-containing protein [Helicobacter cetorum]